MRKIFTLICIIVAGGRLAAQETAPTLVDTSWKKSGFIGITGAKTQLSNWQGGGQNNTAVSGIFNYEAIYRKDEFEQWTNKIDMQYGLIQPGNSKFRKNNDQILALSKYNTKAFEKFWFWAAQVDYRTQFSPGYTYRNDSIAGAAVSDFNSPGYIQLALGLDYKPTDYFSAMIAPLAGKVTIVNRQYLADAGAYGVKKAETDAVTGQVTTRGRKVRYELGGRIIVKFKKDIFKNVNLDSYLDLFSNYLEKPGNVDVIFNNLLTIKIKKVFTATVLCQMLYDDDILIKRDLNSDGIFDQPGEFNGPRLQVLTTFGVGIGYKF